MLASTENKVTLQPEDELKNRFGSDWHANRLEIFSLKDFLIICKNMVIIFQELRDKNYKALELKRIRKKKIYNSPNKLLNLLEIVSVKRPVTGKIINISK